MLLFAIGVAGLYRFVRIHKPDEIRHVISRFLTPESRQSKQANHAKEDRPIGTDQDAGQGPLSEPYEFLLSHGKWGGFFALGLLGFSRFGKYLKAPLSIHLEKYLAKPDYQGHVAFIETFHEDFGRMVNAYAKNRRIFVFIDDLDRCDVPRAAELMQAINLMIGDAGKLIFILGMDREKVAAGIAQKYKDLLPFLPGLASSDSAPGSQAASLYFGYSFLEKFIQLSFTLPVITDPGLLTRFLVSISHISVRSSWFKRLSDFWRSQSTISSSRPRSGSNEISISLAPSRGKALETAVAQEKRVEYLRVKVEKDSEQILQIVSMVSPIFGNNPRKLKQFVNTFRLALFLSSSQGVLDREEGVAPITPEQLGKFVAISLRFPDLRAKLAINLNLLEELEKAAQASSEAIASSPLLVWLEQRGIREVLLYGIDRESDSRIFSLNGFPVRKMMSVLPSVPEKRDENTQPLADSVAQSSPSMANSNFRNEDLLEAFQRLGREYEKIRALETASSERTRKMTRGFQEAWAMAEKLSVSEATDIFDKLRAVNSDGTRVIGIAVANAHPHENSVPWLLELLSVYRSWFEHYQCIRALLVGFNLLSTEDCRAVIATMDRNWRDILKDPGRARLAQDLRARAERSLNRNKRRSLGKAESL